MKNGQFKLPTVGARLCLAVLGARCGQCARFVRCVLFLLSAMVLAPASAALHDAYPGRDLVVHYVHLDGAGGDNALERRLLQSGQVTCVERHALFKRSRRLLSSGEFPAIVIALNQEIYYSPNRTLTVYRGTTNYIDFDSCALAQRLHHTRELNSVRGSCNIDMIKREAHGECDAALQRHAPAPSAPPDSPARRAAVRIAGLMPTSNFNTIERQRCEIYRGGPDRVSELCIARPASRFTIPAAPFNAGVPGLVLAISSPILTERAQRVELDLEVSENMFAVPGGIKVFPFPRRMP